MAKTDPDMEQALETLFAAPPEAFVAERTRLSRERRGAGDAAGAAALAKAQKPTLSAWATNQLARREREVVHRLAEASARVRQAQLGLISGGGSNRSAFATASAAQREALASLRLAAERILAEGKHAVTPSVLERVTRNLRAMVTGEETVRQIEAGRLERDLPAEELADSSSLAAASAPAGRHKGAPARPAAAAAPEPSRAEVRRLERERADRTREVAGLRRAAEQAEGRAAKARAAAARARRAADEAEADARHADADAQEARRRLEAFQRR